jgi:hypothetical protein
LAERAASVSLDDVMTRALLLLAGRDEALGTD